MIVLISLSLLMMAGGWVRMTGIQDTVKNDVSKLMVDVERACIVRPDYVTDKIPHRAVLVRIVESLGDMTVTPAGGMRIAAAIVKDHQFSVTCKMIALAFIILICLSLFFGIRLLYILIRKKTLPWGMTLFALCQALLLLLVLLVCVFLNNHKEQFLSLLTAGGLFSPAEYGLDETIDFRPAVFAFLSAVTAFASWIIAWQLREKWLYRGIARLIQRAPEASEARSVREASEVPEASEARSVSEPGDIPTRPEPATPPASEPVLSEPPVLVLTETEALFGTNKIITAPDGRKLKIHVPEGMNAGNIIRLKGYGVSDSKTGKKNDLQIEIRIRKSPDNVVIR